MAEQVDLTTIPISPNGDTTDVASSTDMDGKLVTVFHDKDNFNVKHPLQNKWTLWFTKPSSGKVSCFCLMFIAFAYWLLSSSSLLPIL
jgi:translation initiation factor 4E